MRADRLLSLLMLLQNRGQLTAAELAAELHVSTRTIYRDVEALCAAGVPLYTGHGPGGGIGLVDSYRTNLTGMTSNEVRALFMLSIPSPLEQLGVSQELKAALLKLSAGLSASQRQLEAWTRQRIHIDSAWWFQADEPVPYLANVQQAVWQDRRLRVVYRLIFGGEIERVIEPYGLVAKAGVWYLVYAAQDTVRALRIASLLQAQVLDETFARPENFDLAAFWEEWRNEYESQRSTYRVKLRVAPELFSELPRFFGEALRSQIEQIEGDEHNWRTLELPFESFYSARGWLLSFGNAVEVLEPQPLRLSLIDFARQVTQFYEGKT